MADSRTYVVPRRLRLAILREFDFIVNGNIGASLEMVPFGCVGDESIVNAGFFVSDAEVAMDNMMMLTRTVIQRNVFEAVIVLRAIRTEN